MLLLQLDLFGQLRVDLTRHLHQQLVLDDLMQVTEALAVILNYFAHVDLQALHVGDEVISPLPVARDLRQHGLHGADPVLEVVVAIGNQAACGKSGLGLPFRRGILVRARQTCFLSDLLGPLIGPLLERRADKRADHFLFLGWRRLHVHICLFLY